MIRLANTPMPHVKSAARSVLQIFRGKEISYMTPNPVSAAERNPESNPAQDSMAGEPHLDIAPNDWDELFHAVTARLEGCVSNTKMQGLADKVPATAQSVQTTVLECVSALNQLHAALVHERQTHKR